MQEARLNRMSRALLTLIGSVTFLGLLVIVGWHTHRPSLVQVVPALVPMQYNTALCFFMTGLSASAIIFRLNALSVCCSGLTAMVGALTLLEYVLAIDLGIDELFMRHWLTVETSHPGRMAPNTAVCFVLSGFALLIVSRRSWHMSLGNGEHECTDGGATDADRLWSMQLPMLLSILSSIVVALATVALFGYFSGVETAYGWGELTRMAVHTAAGLGVVGAGLFGLSWYWSRERGAARWLAWPIGTASLIATIAMWQALDSRDGEQIAGALQRDVASVRRQLQEVFHPRVQALGRMARRWEIRGGTPRAEWEDDARQLIEGQPGTVSMAYIDDKEESLWLVEAEQAHHSQRPDMQSLIREYRIAAQTALETRTVTLSPVFRMREDQRGFFLVTPLYAMDQPDGYVATLVDIDVAMDAILREILANGRSMAIYEGGREIYGRDDDSSRQESLWNEEAEIQLQNRVWRARLWPTREYLASQRSVLPTVALCVGLVTTCLVSLTVYVGQVSVMRARSLSVVNRQLHREVAERKVAENELRKLNLTLEQRVSQRTAELDAANSTLREREVRYQLAIAGTSDGIWDWDMDTGRFWFAPRFCALLGYNEDELPPTYECWESRLHPSDRETTLASLQLHLAREAPFDVEYRLRTKDGRWRWFHGRGAAVYDAAGNPIRMAGSISDITIRKQAHKRLQQYAVELERSNKELDDFAYLASHDLKAPLRGIDNLAKWIAEDALDVLPEESRNHLEKMQKRVQSMERLLDDLLHYSRAGRMEYDIETLNTRELVTGIVDMVAPPEGFNFVISEDLPMMTARKAPLEQTFMNLIVNAIKHHDQPRGRIEIAVHELQEFYEFCVIDDGPGIAPQFHDRVFGLFQTLQPRDEVEGSGMGLAIVRKLVESEGGRVGVRSGPGRGSVFTFTWPKSCGSKEHRAVAQQKTHVLQETA